MVSHNCRQGNNRAANGLQSCFRWLVVDADGRQRLHALVAQIVDGPQANGVLSGEGEGTAVPRGRRQSIIDLPVAAAVPAQRLPAAAGAACAAHGDFQRGDAAARGAPNLGIGDGAVKGHGPAIVILFLRGQHVAVVDGNRGLGGRSVHNHALAGGRALHVLCGVDGAHAQLDHTLARPRIPGVDPGGGIGPGGGRGKRAAVDADLHAGHAAGGIGGLAADNDRLVRAHVGRQVDEATARLVVVDNQVQIGLVVEGAVEGGVQLQENLLPEELSANRGLF